MPRSVNIYRELHTDLRHAQPSNGDLTPWTRQGVLLHNRAPADRGLFGSRPFSRANDRLVRQGGAPVDWRLP